MSAERQLIEINPEQTTVVTPMAMLERAIANGAGLDMVSKLMDLQERWEASNARKAFNEAFAAFKAEAVAVVRNRKVDDGPLKNRRYAELFTFVDAATPALSRHGLSASWDITKDEKDWIEVTCVIEHELGGMKRVSFGGPPDTGGAKNAIQARVSAVTYLERVTFKAATGLAEQGDDDDGRGGGATIAEKVTADQLATIRQKIEATDSDIAVFCGLFRIDALPDMAARDYARAVALLDKKAARK